MVLIKKEVRYLLLKRGSDCQNLSDEKKRLAGQGYLVVTIIEGEEELQKGLLQVLRSHTARRKNS